jgi:hypothetical protein
MSSSPPVPPVNPTYADGGSAPEYDSTWTPFMVTVSPVENVVTTKWFTVFRSEVIDESVVT